MKRKILIGFALIGTMIFVAQAVAADVPASPTNSSAEDAEASYTRAIEGRTADILAILSLTNSVVTVHVHDAVIAQYRALRSWHDANDAQLKTLNKQAETNKQEIAGIQSSLKTLHDQFLAKLSADLTPEQVEKVKDKMTYGVVQVTYNAYLKMYSELTDVEKKQIMTWLVEAREIAMDQGSSDEKHAVFGKYKGRINNYLSKAGYDAKTGKKKSDQTVQSNTNQPTK